MRTISVILPIFGLTLGVVKGLRHAVILDKTLGLDRTEPNLFKGASNIKNLPTEEELDAVLDRSAEQHEIPVVLFYANWCPHCHRFAPVYIKISAELLCHANVKLYGYDCTRERAARCRKLHVPHYPEVAIASAEGKVMMLEYPPTDDKQMLQAIADIRQESLSPCSPVTSTTTANTSAGEEQDRTFYSKDRWSKEELSASPMDHVHDMLVAFRVVLQEWVPSTKSQLTAAERTIMMDLIEYIQAVMPGVPEVGPLAALHDYLSKTTDVDEIGRFAESKLPPRFKVCRTQACGLWTVFHLLAENLVACMTAESCLPNHPNASEAKEIIRAVVANFFECGECQEHFEMSYRACAADICLWTSDESPAPWGISAADWTPEKGLALWLWRFHNVVTVRTALEDIAHGQNMKLLGADVRYPPRSACPTCYRNVEKDLHLTSEMAEGCGKTMCAPTSYEHNESWDATYLQQFLKDRYVKQVTPLDVGGVGTFLEAILGKS